MQDIKEATASLWRAYGAAGGLDGSVPQHAPALRDIRFQARHLLDQTLRQIDTLLTPPTNHRPTTNDQRPPTNDHRPTTNDQQPTTNDQRLTTNDQRLTTLLTAAESLQRLVYGRPDHDYLRTTTERILSLYARQSIEISKTDLTLLILRYAPSRHLPNGGIWNAALLFADTQLTNWLDQLQTYGKFADCGPAETRRRLEYLLRQDLTLHLGSAEQPLKQRWRTQLYG